MCKALAPGKNGSRARVLPGNSQAQNSELTVILKWLGGMILPAYEIDNVAG